MRKRREFKRGLEKLGFELSDGDLSRLMGRFDVNGDGRIPVEEMTIYLKSVFSVLYASQPGLAEQVGVSAEELARVTAEQAFVEADLNEDGVISLDEFKRWYAQAGTPRVIARVMRHNTAIRRKAKVATVCDILREFLPLSLEIRPVLLERLGDGDREVVLVDDRRGWRDVARAVCRFGARPGGRPPP